MSPLQTRTLGERMALAARALQGQVGPQPTMDTAVALAVENVPSCDAAGITLVHGRRRVETAASTGDEVRRADELQYELAQGPCLQAIVEADLVHSPRIGRDDRWPEWGPRVEEETTFRSIFAFRLFTADEVVGALNLYSRSEGAFGADDRDEGIVLSAHVAVAVAAAREVHHAKEGLEGRSVVGQAMGILMERFGMESERAFAVLRRYSQDSNVRLRDVAERVIATRRLPGDEG